MSRHSVNPELAAKFVVFATTHPSVTESAVTLAGHQEGGDNWAKTLTDRNPLLALEPDPYEAITIMAAAIWPDFQEGPPAVGSVAGPIFTEVQAGNITAVEMAEQLQSDLVDLVQTAGFETWELCQDVDEARWTLVRRWAGRHRPV